MEGCRNLLGLHPTRRLWGLYPLDLGCCTARIAPDVSTGTVQEDGVLIGVDKTDQFAKKHHLTPEARDELRKMIAEAGHDDGGHDGHDGHSERIVLVDVPRARHKWGQDKSAIHAPFISLFYDLVFVGIALSLGDLMKTSFYACAEADSGEHSGGSSGSSSGSGGDGSGGSSDSSGSSSLSDPHRQLAASSSAQVGCVNVFYGILHVFVYFSVFFGHWYMATLFNARFVAKGLVHVAAGIVLFCCFLLMATSIESVQATREDPVYLFTFALLQASLFLGWIIRYLQIAVACPEVNARQAASSMVLTNAQSFVIASAALISVSLADWHVTTSGPSGHYEATVVLLLASAYWPVIARLWRHFISPKELHELYQETHVPTNVGFLISRINEFMMLMLGEAVLQLSVAAVAVRRYDSVFLLDRYEGPTFWATFIGGALIAVCQLHVHIETSPHNPKDHALSYSPLHGLWYYLAFSVKACFVMLTGISIKIAIYNPDAIGFFSREQRLLTSLALFGSCGSHLVLHPLHVGFVTYYKPILRCSVASISLAVFVRAGCTLTMLLVAYVEGLHPWETILVQAGLSLVVSLSLAFEMHFARKPHLKHPPHAERAGRYATRCTAPPHAHTLMWVRSGPLNHVRT